MDKQKIEEPSSEDSTMKRNSKRIDDIHETMFVTFLLFYSTWRFCKSRYPRTTVYKNKLRIIGSLMILFSIYSTAVYNYLLLFLNNFFQINKHQFELIGQTHLQFKFNDINLFEVLDISYLLSKTLRISSVFMLLGLWGPCLYSYVNRNKFGFTVFANSNSEIFISKDIFHTSILTFSKIYSIFRIPCVVILHYKTKNMEPISKIFIDSVIYGAELYLCIALVLILRTKHDFISGQKGLDTITLLGFCLGLYAFFAYSLNIVSIPFVLPDLAFQIKQSLIFSLQIIIDLLLVSMFCPLRNQVFDGESSGKEEEVGHLPELPNNNSVIGAPGNQKENKVLIRYN